MKVNMGSEKILYKSLSYRIVCAAMEVHSKLGCGFLEKVYENSLMVVFKKMGIKAQKQVPIVVFFDDEPVGEYFADILVENQVILELKVVDALQKIHEAQLLNYLKATGYKVGLLVNFTQPKAAIRRLIL